MAKAQETDLMSAFPEPPWSFIQHYTNDNVKAGTTLRPPPVPSDGLYVMFGCALSTKSAIVLPLEDQNIARIYPKVFDRRLELKKVNQSILTNFLDILEIMIRCPESPTRQKKLEDLRLLFITAYHLVNEYRPHQARESIRLIMERQLDERLQVIDRLTAAFNKAIDSVETALQNLASNVDSLGLSDDLKSVVQSINSGLATLDEMDGIEESLVPAVRPTSPPQTLEQQDDVLRRIDDEAMSD